MEVRQQDATEGLATLPTEQLEDRIGELAAAINAATCSWLLLIAELDRRGAWSAWGCKSCAEWLSLRCGLGLAAGREHVRVARRLEAFPKIRDAFAHGILSYSKVRAITRVAEHAEETELLELARHATAAQLERLVRKYRWVVATQTEPSDQRHEARYMTCNWEDDGSLAFRGRLPAEDGALLLRALEAAQDRLRVSAETRGPRVERHDAAVSTPLDRAGTDEAGDDVSAETPAGDRADHACATKADALALMAETLLANGPAQRPAGERYQVVVHVDSEQLHRGDEHAGRCELDDGPAIHPETARRLACEASVVAMTLRDGRPLTVGRKTRSVPPTLRRALRARDGCCRFPGCGERRFVDAHHIEHWAKGGETKLSNLLLLCRRHHRLLHEGGFGVERQRDGTTTFRRLDGRPIPSTSDGRRGDCREVRRVALAAGARIEAETCWAASRGERLSYVRAVDGLVAGAARGSPG